jgi:hypothetical protein
MSVYVSNDRVRAVRDATYAYWTNLYSGEERYKEARLFALLEAAWAALNPQVNQADAERALATLDTF